MDNVLTELNLTVSPDLLWGILALVLAGFLVIAAALNHHWKYYGIKDNPKVFAKSFFWIVAVFLILIATFALVAYESNI